MLTPEFSLKAGMVVLAHCESPGRGTSLLLGYDASRLPCARGPQEGARWAFSRWPVLVSWPGKTTAVISLSTHINNMSSPRHSHSSFA